MKFLRPPIAAGKSWKDGFRRGLAVGETSSIRFHRDSEQKVDFGT